MTSIHLITEIKASATICFDLSRSVNIHLLSTAKTNETVIGGRASGLFEKGDTVTWRARHFGIYQTLQMHITHIEFPFFFEDRMLKGIFKSICHRHYFTEKDGCTTMRDEFDYEAPFGWAGSLFDYFLLKKHLTNLLEERNKVIKLHAEAEPILQ